MTIASVLKAGVFAAALGFAGTAVATPLAGSVTINGGAFNDTKTLDIRTDFSPSSKGIAGFNTPTGVTGNFGLLGFAQNVTFSRFDTNSPSSAPIASSLDHKAHRYGIGPDRVKTSWGGQHWTVASRGQGQGSFAG